MPASWLLQNPDTLWAAFVQHVGLVAEALVISLALALPLGILSARHKRVHVFVLGTAGILYTIPELALFALLVPMVGLGRGPALTAIVLYSLLVVTRNVAVGLRELPHDVLEAADGMGYGRWRKLWRIELPLAAPVILAGIRLTVVMQISVATIAAFIGAGGLGEIIFQGITQDIGEKVAAGAVAAALLAVAADEILRRLELRLRLNQYGPG
jgi:osmoprotectant transport system permease protein